MILYEYPFNERIRTYLRLEHLLRRLAELVPREHPLDHHFALVTIFEVMDVAARADLKSDVMKDLDKQRQALDAFRSSPDVSHEVLDTVIAQLTRCFEALNVQPGKAGQSLTENDWLMSIRSRVSIPGGACGFDLPAYYAWQHKSSAVRREQVEEWASNLAPLAESIFVLMKLLRDQSNPQKIMAEKGQFQQHLPLGRVFQLARILIDSELGLIPETSGNRLIVSIRLVRQQEDGRLQQTEDDVPMELALCS